MDSFETPAETAKRELFEEAGLEAIVDDQDVIAVAGEGHNDIQVFYHVRKIVGGALTTSDETDEVRVFREHNLPANIAFASHEQVIRNWFAANSGRHSGADRRARVGTAQG
jgi:8-oxo-dGTP pyrophosphatase MutT (NUDIX family)